jgi:DNA-binding GntR family transcriptional regulator
MTNDEYFVNATNGFPPVANPGAAATIVVGMMEAQITQTSRVHTEATHIYRTYHNVDQAFKKLIIDAFEDPFLNAIYDEIIGYANCTSLQFFLTF